MFDGFEVLIDGIYILAWLDARKMQVFESTAWLQRSQAWLQIWPGYNSSWCNATKNDQIFIRAVFPYYKVYNAN